MKNDTTCANSHTPDNMTINTNTTENMNHIANTANDMTNTNSKAGNPSAYIPTLAEWGEMYEKWHKKLAQALSGSGSSAECEEAVHEAFLKAAGLSAGLHLQSPLTPKTDDAWFGFLKYQAKGRLSCYHQRGKRFEEFKDWSVREESFEPESWHEDGVAGEDQPTAYRALTPDSDNTWVCEGVRKVLADICREAGVKESNLKAYVRFVFDGMSGREVVKEIRDIGNANNLYQVRSRMEKLVKTHRARFEPLYRELMAA